MARADGYTWPGDRDRVRNRDRTGDGDGRASWEQEHDRVAVVRGADRVAQRAHPAVGGRAHHGAQSIESALALPATTFTTAYAVVERGAAPPVLL